MHNAAEREIPWPAWQETRAHGMTPLGFDFKLNFPLGIVLLSRLKPDWPPKSSHGNLLRRITAVPAWKTKSSPRLQSFI